MFAKNFTTFFLLLSMKIGRLKTSEDKNYEKKIDVLSFYLKKSNPNCIAFFLIIP